MYETNLQEILNVKLDWVQKFIPVRPPPFYVRNTQFQEDARGGASDKRQSFKPSQVVSLLLTFSFCLFFTSPKCEHLYFIHGSIVFVLDSLTFSFIRGQLQGGGGI